jgi:hypothetical protein
MSYLVISIGATVRPDLLIGLTLLIWCCGFAVWCGLQREYDPNCLEEIVALRYCS